MQPSSLVKRRHPFPCVFPSISRRCVCYTVLCLEWIHQVGAGCGVIQVLFSPSATVRVFESKSLLNVFRIVGLELAIKDYVLRLPVKQDNVMNSAISHRIAMCAVSLPNYFTDELIGPKNSIHENL